MFPQSVFDCWLVNHSIKEVEGSALVISQFTLCGDWRKGRRPSFIHAAPPEKGKQLYYDFMDSLKLKGVPVEAGEFGSIMDINLINEGPVTFVLDSKMIRSFLFHFFNILL